MRNKSTQKSAATLGAIMILAVGTALAATFFYQGFETDTSGWYDDSNGGLGSITREASGYSNGGRFADGIASAAGSFHARLSSAELRRRFRSGHRLPRPLHFVGHERKWRRVPRRRLCDRTRNLS